MDSAHNLNMGNDCMRSAYHLHAPLHTHLHSVAACAAYRGSAPYNLSPHAASLAPPGSAAYSTPHSYNPSPRKTRSGRRRATYDYYNH